MLQHECGFREASQRRRLTKAQARIVELEAAAELERTRHEARAAAAAGTIASLRDELAALRAERARATRDAERKRRRHRTGATRASPSDSPPPRRAPTAGRP